MIKKIEKILDGFENNSLIRDAIFSNNEEKSFIGLIESLINNESIEKIEDE